MIVYQVDWFVSSSCVHGKGRAKASESHCGFTVICRSSRDAIDCLDFHFKRVFPHPRKFDIGDGEIVLHRLKIDSRGFNANYLLMDGIKEPLELFNLKSNLLRLNDIFR